jgi:D-ornithine 4,5-aminomutase subunit alpha
MGMQSRPDDFESRRRHLASLTDDELHQRFWSLISQLTDPLIEEARTHTSPSIERSVLLRMGFSSMEAKALVDGFSQRGLLGRGAGRLVLELAQQRGVPVREAGEALLDGRLWEDVER